jgi:hypothetical protein
MKKRAKSNIKKKASAHAGPRRSTLPYGMQKTRVIDSAKAKWGKKSDAFTPMETGQPDQEQVADIRNPLGVQSGRGPLNQEGEGDRQNDELAELEEIEPKL